MGKRKISKLNYFNPTFLDIKKRYEKDLLKSALSLCYYQIKYRVISRAANFIFSGEKQKPTRFLRVINKSLNKNLCKCQIIAEKCEYYKYKIDKIKGYC